MGKYLIPNFCMNGYVNRGNAGCPMVRQFEISIPNPCSENWNAMAPTEKGAFCAACSKEVIDFSAMTEQELMAYFTHRDPEQKLCGRFRTEQLGVYTIGIDPKVFRLRIPLWQKILAILVICFGQMVFNNAEAQIKKNRARYALHPVQKKKKKKRKKQYPQMISVPFNGEWGTMGLISYRPPTPKWSIMLAESVFKLPESLLKISAQDKTLPPEPPTEKEEGPVLPHLFRNEDIFSFNTKRRR